MKRPFTVIVTPHYERLFKKLLRTHRDLPALQARVGQILAADPYNVSREHPEAGPANRLNRNPLLPAEPALYALNAHESTSFSKSCTL